VRTLNGVFELS